MCKLRDDTMSQAGELPKEMMMEQSNQSNAAVPALPSDLTEVERLDLLCQVETYMSLTDKHSQTHPAAKAAEENMYNLVNVLIAKRFSDIGAAVRGEAVAWAVTAQRGGIHKLSITKESADRKAAKWRKEWPDNGCAVRPLVFGDVDPASPRAADAPSEPSESGMRAVLLNAKAVIKRWDSPLWRQEVHTADFIDQLRKSVDLAESRAADALSEPSDEAITQNAELVLRRLEQMHQESVPGSWRELIEEAMPCQLAVLKAVGGKVSGRAADALDSQPTVSDVLAELRADISELQDNLETFGEYSQETARVALDGALDALDEVAEKYAAPQQEGSEAGNG